jgi:hypothetical protein
MKKLILAVACIALVGLAPCAYAAQIAVHGDLNNRIQLYNDQQNFFTLDKGTPTLDKTKGQFASFKYRLWTEMATDDNAVKGVYAVEIGGIKFGDGDNGGGYSGDGRNIETRWAYTDFMLGNGRLKIGLQPWSVNSFVWVETATAIEYAASAGNMDYELGYARGKRYANTSNNDAFNQDSDGILGRLNFGIGEGSKAGVFLLYQMANPSAATPGDIDPQTWEVKRFTDVDLNFWTLGVDGKLQTAGPMFLAWDLIYQNGKIENAAYTDPLTGGGRTGDFDLNAYMGHVDVGVKLGKITLKYTGWYASGDDDPNDDNFDAFIATDVDRTESIIFMEGGYTDDFWYTERPYIGDKGMFMNKLACDFQATDKTKVGGALLYMQTAEDIKYTDDNGVARSSSDLGIELDAYVSYQMYKNLEIALNAGYLFSGDAMDVFESTTDGSADENIFRSTARFRYKF